MTYNAHRPPAGQRLVILTAAFCPKHFDFDEALLACASAVEARQLGWEVDVVLILENANSQSYLNVTISILTALDVHTTVLTSESRVQIRAANVAAHLDASEYDAVLTFDPGLVSYAAASPANRFAWRRPYFIAVLCSSEILSRSAQGWFLEDVRSIAAEALTLRGIAAVDACVTASDIAEIFCANNDISGLESLNAEALYISLLSKLPRRLPGRPTELRFVCLGNLDSRIGLDVILAAFQASGPHSPSVLFSGLCCETPTGHGLSEIARFAAQYSGPWSLNLTNDVLRTIRDIRSGDCLVSCSFGGLQSAPAIASIYQSSYLGKDPGMNQLAFGRKLRDAIALGGKPASRNIAPSAKKTPLPLLLAQASAVKASEQSAARISLTNLEIIRPVAECQEALPRRGLFQRNAVLDSQMTTTAGRAAPVQRALNGESGDGSFVGTLDECLRSATSDYCLIVDSRHLSSVDLQLVRLWASRLNSAMLVWPNRGEDGAVIVPPVTVAEILIDSSASPFAWCVSPDVYRRNVEQLISTTLAGAVREISLRLVMAGKTVQCAPAPVFKIVHPEAPPSTVYSFSAYEEAMALLEISVTSLEPELAEAVRLYQGQALRHRQATATAPWGLEPNQLPVYARRRGQIDGPVKSSGQKIAARDVTRFFGRLASSEALWPCLTIAADPAIETSSFDCRAPDALDDKDIFVAWIANRSRTDPTKTLVDAILARIDLVSESRRDSSFHLARYTLEAVGRSDVARALEEQRTGRS